LFVCCCFTIVALSADGHLLTLFLEAFPTNSSINQAQSDLFSLENCFAAPTTRFTLRSATVSTWRVNEPAAALLPSIFSKRLALLCHANCGNKKSKCLENQFLFILLRCSTFASASAAAS